MSNVSGVPWQYVVTVGLLVTAGLVAAAGLGLVTAYFGYAVVAVLCQVVSLSLAILLIPVYLNLSRTFYGYILGILLVHIGSAILQYALLFKTSGLVSGGEVSHSFRDALYFSVTTWTTVGYGDFTALPNMRLITSAEALMGTASLALAVSYMWLFVSEQLLPANHALLDGTRFHLGSLTWHRLRVRGLYRGHRDFDPSYIDRPSPGSVVYRNNRDGRWELLPPGAEIPKDVDIIRF
jgi:hypothetical protein